MNNKPNKSALTDEELDKVVGGSNTIGHPEPAFCCLDKNGNAVKDPGSIVCRDDSPNDVFELISISDNSAPSESEIFSTTYFFKAVCGSAIFAFTATAENRQCQYICKK